jgi:hypothetical protein
VFEILQQAFYESHCLFVDFSYLLMTTLEEASKSQFWRNALA